MVKEGKIVKIIGDLYVVLAEEERFDCKARGKFRNDKLIPLVGDQVLFDEEKKYILELKSRKNSLVRPNIANVDIAIIITSLVKPDISLTLLDKMLTMIIINKVTPLICLTKSDITEKRKLKKIKTILKYYQKLGINVIYNYQINKLKKMIKNKIVVLCGQTGAGKSSLLNTLDKKLKLKIAPISESLGRGKHTTRHVELFAVDKALIADTPGFSALDLALYSEEQIKASFLEFANFSCKFKGCAHLKGDCTVIKAVSEGKILKSRYNSYLNLIDKKEEK